MDAYAYGIIFTIKSLFCNIVGAEGKAPSAQHVYEGPGDVVIPGSLMYCVAFASAAAADSFDIVGKKLAK